MLQNPSSSCTFSTYLQKRSRSRSGHAVVYYNDKKQSSVFVIGGRNESGLLLNTAELFIIKDKNIKSSLIESMPVSLADHRAVEYKKIIFVFGGVKTGSDNTNIVSNSLFEYNISNNNWTELSCMLSARSKFAAVVVVDRIYAVAGEGVTSVEMLDLTSENYVWESVEAAPFADCVSAAAVYFDGFIYVCCERRDGSKELCQYEVETTKWLQNTTFPKGFANTYAMVVAEIDTSKWTKFN